MNGMDGERFCDCVRNFIFHLRLEYGIRKSSPPDKKKLYINFKILSNLSMEFPIWSDETMGEEECWKF